jgi:uncharacterized protein with HEPN domain
MKKKEDRVFLLHIRDSILKILKYREGVSYSEFIEDTSIQDSAIRQLEVISRKNLEIHTLKFLGKLFLAQEIN